MKGVDLKDRGIMRSPSPRLQPEIPLFISGWPSDPGALSEAIRREVQAVDPTIPVFGIQTMDEVVARSMTARRFALESLGIFAIVAFLLACVGIYRSCQASSDRFAVTCDSRVLASKHLKPLANSVYMFCTTG